MPTIASALRSGTSFASNIEAAHRPTVAPRSNSAPLTAPVCSQAAPATEEDWTAEYLDLIISVKVVDDLDAAIDHINHYGSHHSDCIVTKDAAAAERFSAVIGIGFL